MLFSDFLFECKSLEKPWNANYDCYNPYYNNHYHNHHQFCAHGKKQNKKTRPLIGSVMQCCKAVYTKIHFRDHLNYQCNHN